MPRIVSRLLEIANERVAGALFVFAMAMSAGQGPSWQAVATVGGGIVVAGGGWVINRQIDQQTERDRKQDQEREALRADFKESLSAIVATNKETSQKSEESQKRLADSVGSVTEKTTDLAIKVIELGVVVTGTQENQKAVSAKLEALKDKEIEELRKEREAKKR